MQTTRSGIKLFFSIPYNSVIPFTKGESVLVWSTDPSSSGVGAPEEDTVKVSVDPGEVDIRKCTGGDAFVIQRKGVKKRPAKKVVDLRRPMGDTVGPLERGPR
ncbi:MAG: hypothetical protein Q7K35_03830 [bacterium]|nr:hypothetical protein [bacterium]